MTRTMKTFQLMIAVAAFTVATANAQYISTQISPQPAVTVTVTSAVIASAGGQTATKDSLLAGTEKFAQGATSVTEINLDPATMSMMNDRGKDADLAKKMNLMIVHTYSYDKPGMYRQEDVDAFRKKLEDGSWSCFVHTRNENGSSDICSRAGADHETNEMVIFTAKPQKLTFIHMSGKMSLDELSEMSGHANGLAPRHIVVAPMAPMAPMMLKAPKDPKPAKHGKDSTADPAQPAHSGT